MTTDGMEPPSDSDDPPGAVWSGAIEPPFTCEVCGRHITEHVASHDAPPSGLTEGRFPRPSSGFYCPPGDEPPFNCRYSRDVLVDVLVYHQRANASGCGCGWSVLGASHAEHIADVYEQSIRTYDEDMADG